MVFGQLCAPALIYIVFSITQITMDSLKGLYNVAFVKLFISLLFTILLNHLCLRGLGIISWIIVFIPFMLMSLIVALLLTMFGLDPSTGKLNVNKENEAKQRELDAREKAILEYGMSRSKSDYMQRLADMGYADLQSQNSQAVATSILDESVQKGSTKIPVSNPRAKGFREGQKILIGSGSKQEERTIVGFGSIVLDRPLEYDHTRGSLVFIVIPSQYQSNRSHSSVYDGTSGTSSYDLVQGSSARNRLRTRVLAEEIYYSLESKVSNSSITLEKDVAGKTRKIFLDNCDTVINIIYEDLYYRLNNIDGIFDLPQDEQADKIKQALLNINNWGVIRNTSGTVAAYNNFDVNDFRKYQEQLQSADSSWTDTVISNYQTRISSKYESKCTKIQVKLNNYAQEAGINFDDVYTNNGESAFNSLYDQAYNSDTLNSNFVAPTSCTSELSTLCQLRKSGECRPCDKSTEFIEGSSSVPAKVACPYLCASSDLDLSDSSTNINKSKLCGYCHLCKGPATNDPLGTGTTKSPPDGKAWVTMSNLVAGTSITDLPLPTKFNDVGNQLGAGNKNWWKLRYPSESGVSIRSCPADSTRTIDGGTMYTREQNQTYGQHRHVKVSKLLRAYSSIDGVTTIDDTVKNTNENAQSMIDSASGWLPKTDDASSFISLDLGGLYSVRGVITQSHASGTGDVSKYTVETSTDGSSWTPVDANKKFTHDYGWKSGTVGWNKRSQGTFADSVQARYVKIKPVEKVANKRYGMRVGLFAAGCSSESCITNELTTSTNQSTTMNLNPLASARAVSGTRAGITAPKCSGSHSMFNVPSNEYASAWCAENNTKPCSDATKTTQATCVSPATWTAPTQFIQLDLESDKTVHGLSIMGRADANEYIKTFMVQYASNSAPSTFITVKNAAKTADNIFNFNLSGSTAKTYFAFPEGKIANVRYIKVIPMDWYGWPSLRVGDIRVDQ